MKVLVDSSIIIDYLRGGKKWEAFITSAEEDIQLFLPTVVIFELFSGTSTKNPTKLKDMISFTGQFQKIDLNEHIARVAGEIFRDAKIRIQVPDYLIAASALEIGGTVLTLNRKHFEDIPNLPLYPL